MGGYSICILTFLAVVLLAPAVTWGRAGRQGKAKGLLKKMLLLNKVSHVVKAGIDMSGDWKSKSMPKFKNGSKLESVAVVDKVNTSIKVDSGEYEGLV